MQYISTRGGISPQNFSDILLGGLAADGGLIVPESYPKISGSELQRWRGLNYKELAFEILSLYASDINRDDLHSLINRTYTAEIFGNTDIAPLRTLTDGVHILELSNGPTLAFKDMAMQLLGNLFSYVLEKKNQGSINILGATSGDTGSAAEYAMLGKSNVRVFMLSPHEKVSPFQGAQMFSLNEPNIFNLAVRGVFDDCQDMVKAVSEDADFKAKHSIGAVNSINWARVSAQIVYYFKAYFEATNNNDQCIDMAVPSGNFGNICAGHIAKQMGLPIRNLILACNENNVLDEFFRTGCYRVRPADQVMKTSSPSMDISKASNFERFIFDLVGRDSAVVNDLWRQVNQQDGFDLSSSSYFSQLAEYGFLSGTSCHADRLETIRWVYEEFGQIIDTHTADGIKVALEHRDPNVPLVCQETALPVKFEDSIVEALGLHPPRPKGFEGIEQRPQTVTVIDADAAQVKQFIEQHVS